MSKQQQAGSQISLKDRDGLCGVLGKAEHCIRPVLEALTVYSTMLHCIDCWAVRSTLRQINERQGTSEEGGREDREAGAGSRAVTPEDRQWTTQPCRAL